MVPADLVRQERIDLKEAARNIFFAVAVIAVVVLWYGISNNFSGVITAKDEFKPSAETLKNQLQSEQAPALDAGEVAATTTTVSATEQAVVSQPLSAHEIYLQSALCRSQHDDLLAKKSYAEIVQERKANPQRYDVKCFMVNESVDQSILQRCLGESAATGLTGDQVREVMCQAFLKVYQTYVTDYRFPDSLDVKSLPQEVLQKKIQAQLLKHVKNPNLLLAMTKTLIESYPNDFDTLKVYIKALGFGQRPQMYAEGGPLFKYVVRAYGLNPRDLEMREMYMYALIHSADGEKKLLQVFPNVKEDGKLQALRYYYLAWAGWNKGDRTQALNNLEFAKSLSNNDARYSETYDKVKDEINVPKAEGLFYLSFSLI